MTQNEVDGSGNFSPRDAGTGVGIMLELPQYRFDFFSCQRFAQVRSVVLDILHRPPECERLAVGCLSTASVEFGVETI